MCRGRKQETLEEGRKGNGKMVNLGRGDGGLTVRFDLLRKDRNFRLNLLLGFCERKVMEIASEEGGYYSGGAR